MGAYRIVSEGSVIERWIIERIDGDGAPPAQVLVFDSKSDAEDTLQHLKSASAAANRRRDRSTPRNHDDVK